MRTYPKRFLAMFLLILPIAAVFYATSYPLKEEIEKRLTTMLTQQGFTNVAVSVAGIDNRNITFAHIRLSKEKMKVDMEGLTISATNLPYRELLQNNYTNLAAQWTLRSLEVAGIPYELPVMTGSGVYYMKDANPTVAGELYDQERTHQTHFTVTPSVVLLEDTQVEWQKAQMTASEIVHFLKEKKPTLIPLKVRNLPLETLLSMLGDKASGTGTVSGAADLIIYPDGRFGVGDGKFTALGGGVLQLSPQALPGDQPQMEMARNALSNLHYTELSITLVPDNDGKVTIALRMEGRNPDAFDGKGVNLNVNLSGDVLDLVQQTLLPLADPTKYLEKE